MSSVYIIASEPSLEHDIETLANKLRKFGHSVFSYKSTFDDYHKKFHGYLKETDKVKLRLRQLLTCDFVATLDGWTDDKTCQLEMSVATATGKDTIKILKG